MQQRLWITIESNLSDVPGLASAAAHLCRESGLKSFGADQIRLCVAEAANNAIEHAYASEPGHRVELEMHIDPSQIRIVVTDQGSAMNPAALRASASLGNPSMDDLDSLSVRGRGLFIIQSAMDEVSYFSDQKGNHLSMVKRVSLDRE